MRRGASLDFAQHTSCRHPLYPLRHALAEERETRCKPDPLRIRRRRLRSHTSLEVKTSTMAADDSTWGASGEVHVCSAHANAVLTGTTGPTSLESRFFVDDGAWNGAPLLTGQTDFAPLADVKNILVTGGEGFM